MGRNRFDLIEIWKKEKGFHIPSIVAREVGHIPSIVSHTIIHVMDWVRNMKKKVIGANTITTILMDIEWDGDNDVNVEMC